MERAFARFAKTQVDASEIEKLKDIFGRMIFSLEEKSMAKVPYPLAVKEAEKQVEKEMAQLKAAPACIPPCGFQKEARQYRCSSCTMVDCSLPIDCPIQDVHKSEGDVTLLSCGVKFEIPEDATFRWKFVKEIRTNKVFLFQDLNFGFNPSLLIRPTLGSHHGTFACQIAGEDGVLVRKFFYLNVTEKRLHLEKELQEMFKAILNPPPMVEVAGETWGEEVQTNLTESEMPSLEEILSGPDFLHKKVVVFLIVGIAMLSTLATMIAMTIYRWATDIKLQRIQEEARTSPRERNKGAAWLARAERTRDRARERTLPCRDVHSEGPKMKEEVEKAVWFISRVMDRDRKLEKEKVERFRESLATILCERYKDHWYPEKPCKGQAYRCIRINRQYTKDDAILKACMESGLDYSELTLKGEITIWIDPGEVSCRSPIATERRLPFGSRTHKAQCSATSL
ncbi:acrosome membrane-associated 6 isoform X1 [Podarcis lilfordi]|uniref:Acrosome membrane-associated 6 isoform X1 n=1 Tax=Podarcis lilfordi TaxID=74358 RepID=A0AA35KN04_9SAUR|nr:acrosome membrane-associated 6 isoform X1 [Podarcis lilfordi]